MDNWTKEELIETVIEYKKLQESISKNEKVVKSEVYKRLSKKFGRTPKSYGRRFSNISYVLTLSGREWISGLKPLANVGVNVINDIEDALAKIESRTKKIITIPTALKTEVPVGNKQPTRTDTTISDFVRDKQVVEWIKKNAKGNCELCGKYAPFHDSLNNPFLEVHHVKQLAEGGSDTIHNAVALCPNCHRELHFGINFHSKKNQLYSIIERLIPE
jgi:5-methylcytosine-specific restriction protein A